MSDGEAFAVRKSMLGMRGIRGVGASRCVVATLVGLLAIATAACSSTSGDEGGDAADIAGDAPMDAADGADGDSSPPAEDVQDNTTGYCLTTNDCPSGWCDKRKRGCVECYLAAHCPDAATCFNGLCLPDQECTSDAECGDGRCSDSTCVECTGNADCPSTWECVDQICRPSLIECAEDADCLGMGGSCNPSTNRCVDCLDQSSCAKDEFCLDNACQPDACPPSSVTCATETSLRICRDDGTGAYITPCDEGLSCLAGACVDPQCDAPGTSKCLREKVELCTEQGFKIINSCLPNQECVEGQCVPLRQRVLIVFDTSGSMNADPEIQNYPDLCQAGGNEEKCIEPWPTCDPAEAPFTVLGISKKVFSNFFKSEESENVFFALQRFPQRTLNSAPVCDGGYSKGDVVVTGDNGAHEIPVGIETWFDQNRSEIILVPFPPPNSSSNLLALNQWLDFKEGLFKTEDPCFKSSDCVNGVCLGPTGNKRCNLFTNPELRAHGWTPLGKSLFYAGEYFRRNVIVDGKPCTSDGDCGSPGYYCNDETKKCYDPLKDCRLNVVVLFTDGGETQFPFTNDFFNPQVQAKRLRYGLGCESDADCSDLPYCRPRLTDRKCTTDADCLNEDTCHFSGYCAEATGTECFHATCKQGINGGYCTNAIIEGTDLQTNAPVLGAGANPIIQFRDTGYDADRLRDFNGNPINLIVNVVDASLLDPESVANGALTNNYQIALNGGGLHVVVSVTNEADFLKKLRATIDFKSLYEQCLVED